jgi:hypothetical protein
VRIRVTKSWLAQNSIAIEDVTVYGLGSSGWTAYPTTIVSEGEDEYYLTTASISVTTFAVAGKTGNAIDESSAAAIGVPTQEPEPSNPSQTFITKISAESGFSTTAILIGCMLAIIVIGGASLIVHHRTTRRLPGTALALGHATNKALEHGIEGDSMMALEQYVRSLRSQGVPDSSIETQLHGAGWPQPVLDAYFRGHKDELAGSKETK